MRSCMLHIIMLNISFSFLQQFPQLDKEMVQVLQASLDHYQQLKMMEDMLKDDDQTKKVQNRI